MRITCHIATVPVRLESLNDCIASLYSQVDEIYVMLNGHKEAPNIEDPPKKIHYTFLDNSLGDGAKLWDIDKREGFVAFCDDDLVYPHNYISYMLAKYEMHPHSIVTLHGKSYSRPIVSSRRGYRERYHCLHTVDGDHRVEVGGTGVMLLNTADVKLDIRRCLRPNMLDIWVAQQAWEQKVPIWVVSHRIGWLRYTSPKDTIWHSRSPQELQYEGHILSSFLK